MRVTYQSARYAPELVTGRTVRRLSAGYRVYEASTHAKTDRKGHGLTLREWDTDGEEIPQDVKTKAFETWGHVSWPLWL